MAEAVSVLPIALKVDGRHCVVVGGGPIATRKVRDLLHANARVHVVSPRVTGELSDLITKDNRVTWRNREYEPADLDGAALVVTATARREVDAAVFADAQQRGLLVNSADDPENCNFYLMALVRRDPVVVAVSTAGTSPALAAYLKRRLESDLEEELGKLAEVLGDIRDELHARKISTEQLPWSDIINDELMQSAKRGEWNMVRSRVMCALGVAP